ncbi:YegS/Rv2252/BmrU family lipid kinase [Streptococcaceae bacterium ESL0687]|nr:YegS/Rv2252/BmrU family lipid kinase [Streptococcaceae bacterium ESL0687]
MYSFGNYTQVYPKDAREITVKLVDKYAIIVTMKYYLLVNPTSGGGTGAKTAQILCDFLKEKNLAHEKYLTNSPRGEADPTREILKVIKPQDLLIIVGGDGTLSNVINYLPLDQKFSYIRAGSGNDFANSMNLPKDPIESLKKIIDGKPTDFYVIKYQSESLSGYALNNLGIGLDASIALATNESSLKTILAKYNAGGLAYLINALKVILTKKSFEAEINGQSFKNIFLLTITSHAFFGGGYKIAPQESSLEEKLTLVELPKIGLHKLIKIILQLLQAKHLDNKNVYHTRAKSFSIRVKSKEIVQVDGETYKIKANETINLRAVKRTIII